MQNIVKKNTLIISSKNQNKTTFGTCFALNNQYVLTAKHNIRNQNDLKCYFGKTALETDDFVSLDFVYQDPNFDFAILKFREIQSSDVFKPIRFTDFNLSHEETIQYCGYPIQKEQSQRSIDASIIHIFEEASDESTKHCFESSRCKYQSILNYKGMSGSPIMYKGYVVGLLNTQELGRPNETTSLLGISSKKIQSIVANEINFDLEFFSLEEVNYEPPEHPPSPFKSLVVCSEEAPNMNGLDIGFELQVWRMENLVELSKQWIFDYATSASRRPSFLTEPMNFLEEARHLFEQADIDLMTDLFLHIAVRQTYKTIPVVRKVFNIDSNEIYSFNHVVINQGCLELWIGASSIASNLEDAIDSVINRIQNLFKSSQVKERLKVITASIDKSWPFIDRLKKISDPSISFDQKFDKIVIPVFIAYESDAVSKQKDDSTAISEFRKDLDRCRHAFIKRYQNDIIDLIDIKIFFFPSQDINDLHDRFREGII